MREEEARRKFCPIIKHICKWAECMFWYRIGQLGYCTVRENKK